MKALVKTRKGIGHIEVRDVPEPKPGPGEVKIKIEDVSLWEKGLEEKFL